MAIATGERLLVRNVATGAELMPPVKLEGSAAIWSLAMRGRMLVVDDQLGDDERSRVIVDMATRRVVMSF